MFRKKWVTPSPSFTSYSFAHPQLYALKNVTGCWGLCAAIEGLLTQMSSSMHLFRTDTQPTTINTIITPMLDHRAIIMTSEVKAGHN